MRHLHHLGITKLALDARHRAQWGGGAALYTIGKNTPRPARLLRTSGGHLSRSAVDDCDVIICYGGAKPTDRHLTAAVHCVDDEIIEWLERRREQRRSGVATRSGQEYGLTVVERKSAATKTPSHRQASCLNGPLH
jgi:hypothetical protein